MLRPMKTTPLSSQEATSSAPRFNQRPLYPVFAPLLYRSCTGKRTVQGLCRDGATMGYLKTRLKAGTNKIKSKYLYQLDLPKAILSADNPDKR